MKRNWFWAGVVILLCLMGAVEVVTASGETQIWDEGIHIASGYAYLKYGDYAWNNEHPALVKTLSALMLVPFHPKLPVDGKAWKERDQVDMGIDFMYHNRVPADTLLLRARLPVMALTLVGGLLLALWMRRRFGSVAALIALAFYVLDPNLIAHGRYVTTDAPMAVACLVTCMAWCEYLVLGRRRDLCMAAFAFAFAMSVKYSAVILIPVVALLYVLRWVQVPKAFPLRRIALAFGATLAACVLLIAPLYWRETGRALSGDQPRLIESLHRDTPVGKVLRPLARWFRLPRHEYLVGLDAVAEHNRSGHPAYLLGEHSDKGWWYYFPVVYAVKSTLAALALTLLLAGAVLWAVFRTSPRRLLTAFRGLNFAWLAMLLPAAVWFGMACSSGINLGVRHILPVYPLLYAAGGALLAQGWHRPALRYAALSLVLLQTAESASIYPDYLAFFNAASGGPANGPHYLVDSNIDWGQDVKKLSRWLHEHGTRRVWINYFGKAIVSYYDIDEMSLPPASEKQAWDEIDGYVAVSATPLNGVYVPYAEFAPLRNLPVIARIGYSIYIYDMRKHKP